MPTDTITQYAIYQMKKNKYLGDCIGVIYKTTPSEREQDALTGENIVILIKYNSLIHHELKNLSLASLQTAHLFDIEKPILLRIGSECMFSMYGDSHCDCEPQRIKSLEEINKFQQGVYIHFPQEAQGRGLHYKAQELQLQVSGTLQTGEYVGEKSIVDASRILIGHSEQLDIRNYTTVKKIFSDLGLNAYVYQLISANPKKIAQLTTIANIKINGIHDIELSIDIENMSEYIGKVYMKGYNLSPEQWEKMIEIANSSEYIPQRLSSICHLINEDLSDGIPLEIDKERFEKLFKSIVNREHAPEFVTPLSTIKSHLSQYDDTSIENEVEVIYRVKDDIFQILADVFHSKKYINYISYEKNYYYDILESDLMRKSEKTLKIRHSKPLIGALTHDYSRIIYKVNLSGPNSDDNKYKVISLMVPRKIEIEFFEHSPFYKRYLFLESITSVINIGQTMRVRIKKYPHISRTLEISGPQHDVQALIKAIDVKSKFTQISPNQIEDFYTSSIVFGKKRQYFDEELTLTKAHIINKTEIRSLLPHKTK